MSSCQLFVPVFVNTGKSIGGRNRTLVTRVWNPVRSHCAPTWMKRAKKKEPPAAGHPAQTAPGRISRSEITQVGRPHAGSARWRAGGSRCLRARIAGMPTKPWGQAAMPFSGSACRTRCLLEVVVLAGISLTHPAQPSQRICGVNCSHAYLLSVRCTPTPAGSAPYLGPHGPSTDRHRPATKRYATSVPLAAVPTAPAARPPPQTKPLEVSDSETPPPSRYTLASASAPPAALAQSAERLTRNEKVVGSIPTGGSTRTPRSEGSFLARGFLHF